MLHHIKSDTLRHKNIEIITDRLIVKFTHISNCNPIINGDFEDFGQIECDVVIRYFPNKFAYRVENFNHVPLNNHPPCSNNLKVLRPKCFEGKPYEKYWKKVKQGVIYSMNDFIMSLFYKTVENQPTRKVIKMDDYYLARNRK